MKKRIRIILLVAAIAAVVFLTSGCVPGDGTNSAYKLAGFFSGVWHGWIAPISLIYSFFHNSTGIYEVNNNGIPYNIGYYMAIISGFGGLALVRRNRRGDH